MGIERLGHRLDPNIAWTPSMEERVGEQMARLLDERLVAASFPTGPVSVEPGCEGSIEEPIRAPSRIEANVEPRAEGALGERIETVRKGREERGGGRRAGHGGSLTQFSRELSPVWWMARPGAWARRVAGQTKTFYLRRAHEHQRAFTRPHLAPPPPGSDPHGRSLSGFRTDLARLQLGRHQARGALLHGLPRRKSGVEGHDLDRRE